MVLLFFWIHVLSLFYMCNIKIEAQQSCPMCLKSPALLYLVCVSEAGVLVKSYVDRGILVPDDIMTRLMLPKLEQLSTHSWLLDGESSSIFLFIHVCDSYTCPVFFFLGATVSTQNVCWKMFGQPCARHSPSLIGEFRSSPGISRAEQDRTQMPDQEADCRPDAVKWHFSDQEKG